MLRRVVALTRPTDSSTSRENLLANMLTIAATGADAARTSVIIISRGKYDLKGARIAIIASGDNMSRAKDAI